MGYNLGKFIDREKKEMAEEEDLLKTEKEKANSFVIHEHYRRLP